MASPSDNADAYGRDEQHPRPDDQLESNRLNLALEETIGASGIDRDTSKRGRGDASLGDGDERLRLALDAGRMGTWEWHIPTGTVVWSTTLEQIHGLPPGGFSGTFEAYQRDIHPEDRQRVLESIRQTVDEGREHHLEYRIIWPDGSVHWVEGRGKVFHDDTGQPVRVIGVCSDITQRKHLEQEVQEADRRKDEFLATLAHELRNPLAPIRSGLDLLAMETASHQETVGLMQEQVEHLVRLVDDLLDVSRIMRGRVELRKEPIELSVLIKRSVEAARPLIDSHEQELVVRVPEPPIWLNADPIRLVQVIENLLNNASKYTERGGRIELTAERQHRQVAISVRDNGIGIEPALLPKVFEPFTQSSRSLDRAQGGLGIGLTLVARLVELHDGTVSAHSEGPGRGSMFVVRLPVVRAAAQIERAMEQPRATQGRRILVVDDNVGAARMLAKLLTKLGGHEVQTVHDGPSALATVNEFRPEIVLLDIGLPGMDGHQVARILRGRPECEGILLAALTGYGQLEDRQRAIEAGFDRYLVKPVEASELEELVGEFRPPGSGAGRC